MLNNENISACKGLTYEYFHKYMHYVYFPNRFCAFGQGNDIADMSTLPLDAYKPMLNAKRERQQVGAIQYET